MNVKRISLGWSFLCWLLAGLSASSAFFTASYHFFLLSYPFFHLSYPFFTLSYVFRLLRGASAPMECNRIRLHSIVSLSIFNCRFSTPHLYFAVLPEYSARREGSFWGCLAWDCFRLAAATCQNRLLLRSCGYCARLLDRR